MGKGGCEIRWLSVVLVGVCGSCIERECRWGWRDWIRGLGRRECVKLYLYRMGRGIVLLGGGVEGNGRSGL